MNNASRAADKQKYNVGGSPRLMHNVLCAKDNQRYDIGGLPRRMNNESFANNQRELMSFPGCEAVASFDIGLQGENETAEAGLGLLKPA